MAPVFEECGRWAVEYAFQLTEPVTGKRIQGRRGIVLVASHVGSLTTSH